MVATASLVVEMGFCLSHELGSMVSMVSYYTATFGGHSHSGNRYIMVFVCHMTLHSQVKALHEIFKRTPARSVTSLAVIGTVIVEI